MNNKNRPKPVLNSPKTAEELLEIYFPDMRSALVETAATLDRIQRAENGGDVLKDPRIQQLHGALDILKTEKKGRPERILRLLSDLSEP